MNYYQFNMLIPCAGEGTRFFDSGYTLPKLLLDMKGKKMIQRVIENLYDPRIDFIFCVRQEHIDAYGIDECLKDALPDCKIVPVKQITDGPTSTCLLARNFIDGGTPLFITNSDQIIKDWDLDKFLKFCDKHEPDGVLGTFESQHPKNSYILLNEMGHGILVAEKSVISEHATNGMHYWKQGSLFLEAADAMIKAKDNTNGEYYVAPTYNYLIKDGKIVMIYKFHEHYPIGIPVDFEYYVDKIL